MNMNEIYEYATLRPAGVCRLLVQIHDELLLEVHQTQLASVAGSFHKTRLNVQYLRLTYLNI